MDKKSGPLLRPARVVATTQKRVHYMMGAFVTIEVSDVSEDYGVRVIEKAFSEMKRIEVLLSKFSEESVVSWINRHASERPVQVPNEVFELIQKSVEYSNLTEGAFDITINPLVKLWEAAEKSARLPSAKDIELTLEKVGFSNLVFDPFAKTIFFSKPGMQLDLGAIGKGYAVDQAIRILKEAGVEEAVVSTGSTIFYLNKKSSNFGVRDPRDHSKIIVSVELQNSAVSTSANYERFYTIGGNDYGHLLHPQTGWPEQEGCLSVSVIASSAMLSDVLATAFYFLDKDKILTLSRNLNVQVVACSNRRRWVRRDSVVRVECFS